jgi:hypothetical protein
MIRYATILARGKDSSSVFKYAYGEDRLDSRLRWWFFGFGGRAATVWWRKGTDVRLMMVVEWRLKERRWER